jgi:hypothetical protein
MDAILETASPVDCASTLPLLILLVGISPQSAEPAPKSGERFGVGYGGSGSDGRLGDGTCLPFTASLVKSLGVQ